MPGKSLAQENPAAMDQAHVNDDGSISISASAMNSLPDSGYTWDTVHVEAPTQITFDAVGDTFVGLYVSKEVIEFTGKRGDEEFTQMRFLVDDEPYAINAGYDLERGFKGIPTGVIVRIQLRKLVDVGQATPLKSYRVDVAQPARLPSRTAVNAASRTRDAIAASEAVHALRDNLGAVPLDEPPF